eukprot:SAG31_NODE_5020_length_2795_cov_2.019669_1_plen_773_part_01
MAQLALPEPEPELAGEAEPLIVTLPDMSDRRASTQAEPEARIHSLPSHLTLQPRPDQTGPITPRIPPSILADVRRHRPQTPARGASEGGLSAHEQQALSLSRSLRIGDPVDILKADDGRGGGGGGEQRQTEPTNSDPYEHYVRKPGATIERVVDGMREGDDRIHYDVHVPGMETATAICHTRVRLRQFSDRFLLRSGDTAVALGPVDRATEPRLHTLLHKPANADAAMSPSLQAQNARGDNSCGGSSSGEKVFVQRRVNVRSDRFRGSGTESSGAGKSRSIQEMSAVAVAALLQQQRQHRQAPVAASPIRQRPQADRLSEQELDRLAVAVRDERHAPFLTCRAQIRKYLTAAAGDRVLLDLDSEAYARVRSQLSNPTKADASSICPTCNLAYSPVGLHAPAFCNLPETWQCRRCHTSKAMFGCPATVFDYDESNDLYGLISDSPVHGMVWACGSEIRLHPLVVIRWKNMIEGVSRLSRQHLQKLTPLLGNSVKLNEILSLHHHSLFTAKIWPRMHCSRTCCKSDAAPREPQTEAVLQQIHDVLLFNGDLGRHNYEHINAALRHLDRSYCESCGKIIGQENVDNSVTRRPCASRQGSFSCRTEHPEFVTKRFPRSVLDEYAQGVLGLANMAMKKEAGWMLEAGQKMIKDGAFADAAKVFNAAAELCRQCDVPLLSRREEIQALKKQESLARRRNRTLMTARPQTDADWHLIDLPMLKLWAKAACWAASIPDNSIDGADKEDVIQSIKKADDRWRAMSLGALKKRAQKLKVNGGN